MHISAASTQPQSCFDPSQATIPYVSLFPHSSYKRDDGCKLHKFQPLSCFSRDLTFTKRTTFARFPHGYKRNLIFIKSITFAYFLVFPTATSAIWYSQKMSITSPLFSPRLQARFDIHKKCQLHPFRCFPNGYKRDLIFTKSGNCAYSVLSHFPAFPTVLNSYSTAICVREKPISSTGRPK